MYRHLGRSPCVTRVDTIYDGKHDILLRTRLSGLPNNRIVHAFPRYIAQVSAAYLLGEPVRVEGPEPAAEHLRALLRQSSADSIDVELAVSQAVFGRAVSLVYEGADRRPYVCSLDPRAAFVVYSDSVQHDPLFGVHLSGAGVARSAPVLSETEAGTQLLGPVRMVLRE